MSTQLIPIPEISKGELIENTKYLIKNTLAIFNCCSKTESLGVGGSKRCCCSLIKYSGYIFKIIVLIFSINLEDNSLK